MSWQCLRDGEKALILMGFLDENVKFTPLEDRIGSQDMWRLKEICSENLELMNAGIILRNNGKLPIFYKRNLDSNIECCTIMLTEPTTPLIFMRNPVGLFICGLFYVSVSKQSLTIEQQMQPIFDKILIIIKRNTYI